MPTNPDNDGAEKLGGTGEPSAEVYHKQRKQS